MSVGTLLFSRLPTMAVRAIRRAAGRRVCDGPSVHPIINILVLRFDNMGDVVMSTPIFREIKQHYPEAELTVAVQERCRQIVETNPFVDRVLGIAPIAQTHSLVNFLALLSSIAFYFRYLRTRNFDIVLHPRVGSDVRNESLLIALINAPLAIGYSDDTPGRLGRSERNRVLTRVLQQPGPQNEVFSNTAIVCALTQVKFFPKTEIFLSNNDLAFAAKTIAPFPADSLVVALGFGATLRRRQWPSSKWVETLNMLARKYRISVLILAAQADAKEAEHISSALQINAEILIGASIREVAACIGNSHLFVGVDSGLAHIAAAVNIPVVVVSPHPKNGDPAHHNSPVRFAPFGDKVSVVNPASAIPPCSVCCDMQTAHCILQVTPQDVVEACAQILETTQINRITSL